ncbi:hypothetical protein C0991_011049 [Blastosporella zonata]|nr:hypothetical protein C0991_011049 [Blastosporella zonata]
MPMSDVGGYIYVGHCLPVGGCEGPKVRRAVLEQYESERDREEQEMMGRQADEAMPSSEFANADLLARIRESALLAALNTDDAGDDVDMEEDVDAEEDVDMEGGVDQGLGGRREGGRWVDDGGVHPSGGPATYNAGGAPTGTPALPVSAAAAGFNPPQSYGPRIDRQDCFGNQIIRLVHTNGVQYITLLSCSCSGTNNWATDLAHAMLIPTSFHSPRTFFTATVLDDYRLTNLECKASAYQYWQKICRVTSSTAPGEVDNLYRELRRLSRSWRWLKKVKWAGFPHTGKDFMEPGPGELAIFCPTCPQPGVNLPSNWEDDAESWKYSRSLIADGNFKGDHVRHKNPGRDVWHAEGGGMVAKREESEAYFRKAKNIPTGVPCENTFRAIERAMAVSKACDVNGIIAVACARHGCFAPNSLTDLPFGEGQIYADFAITRAMRTTQMDRIRALLLIYDIVCQYCVHFFERLTIAGVVLPDALVVDWAIGLLHVHGHKEDCYFRFATTFIPGAAHLPGEIIESLWSTLNEVAQMARTATLAHRAEILDEHMADSNWKKMQGMVTSLCKKYKLAQEMYGASLAYFGDCSKGSTPQEIQKWESDIKEAETRRRQDRKAMDVLKAQLPTPTEPPLGQFQTLGLLGCEGWLSLALDVEEAQVALQDRVRQLEARPTEEESRKVQQSRERLRLQLNALASAQADAHYAPNLLPPSLPGLGQIPGAFDEEEEQQASFPPAADWGRPSAADWGRPSAADLGQPPAISALCQPEDVPLALPSSAAGAPCTFGDVEIRLRIGQVERLLQSIRELIAESSFMYSHVVRVAPRKQVKTRARASVAALRVSIATKARSYNIARGALLRLGAGGRLAEKYKVLQRADLAASTAIRDPNIPGSSRLQLSWLWRTNGENVDDPAAVQEFKRVHYLRARAQNDRWCEEHKLVSFEMDWTVRYFYKQADIWSERGKAASADGESRDALNAYAKRKAAMWREFAAVAQYKFQIVNKLPAPNAL